MQAFGGAVVLMLLCMLLQANPLPVTKNKVDKIQVLLELQDALKDMKKWTCNEMLYIPTNVKEPCFRTTLRCFFNELNSTNISCKKDHRRKYENFMNDFHSWVSYLENFLPSTNTSCHSCENFETKDFQTFRNEFQTFSEQLMTCFNKNANE